MLRKALRNGLILALLSMLVFFKAIEIADAWTGRHTIEQPITPARGAGLPDSLDGISRTVPGSENPGSQRI